MLPNLEQQTDSGQKNLRIGTSIRSPSMMRPHRGTATLGNELQVLSGHRNDESVSNLEMNFD